MDLTLKYIEKKTGYSDDGPAWIAYCKESKTGQTLYFKGMAFKSSKGDGIYGNYYEVSSGDEYWISGPKKDGGDRHIFGKGVILVQSQAVQEYLNLRGVGRLNPKYHKEVEIKEAPYSESLHEHENEKKE